MRRQPPLLQDVAFDLAAVVLGDLVDEMDFLGAAELGQRGIAMSAHVGFAEIDA